MLCCINTYIALQPLTVGIIVIALALSAAIAFVVDQVRNRQDSPIPLPPEQEPTYTDEVFYEVEDDFVMGDYDHLTSPTARLGLLVHCIRHPFSFTDEAAEDTPQHSRSKRSARRGGVRRGLPIYKIWVRNRPITSRPPTSRPPTVKPTKRPAPATPRPTKKPNPTQSPLAEGTKVSLERHGVKLTRAHSSPALTTYQPNKARSTMSLNSLDSAGALAQQQSKTLGQKALKFGKKATVHTGVQLWNGAVSSAPMTLALLYPPGAATAVAPRAATATTGAASTTSLASSTSSAGNSFHTVQSATTGAQRTPTASAAAAALAANRDPVRRYVTNVRRFGTAVRYEFEIPVKMRDWCIQKPKKCVAASIALGVATVAYPVVDAIIDKIASDKKIADKNEEKKDFLDDMTDLLNAWNNATKSATDTPMALYQSLSSLETVAAINTQKAVDLAASKMDADAYAKMAEYPVVDYNPRTAGLPDTFRAGFELNDPNSQVMGYVSGMLDRIQDDILMTDEVKERTYRWVTSGPSIFQPVQINVTAIQEVLDNAEKSTTTTAPTTTSTPSLIESPEQAALAAVASANLTATSPPVELTTSKDSLVANDDTTELEELQAAVSNFHLPSRHELAHRYLLYTGISFGLAILVGTLIAIWACCKFCGNRRQPVAPPADMELNNAAAAADQLVADPELNPVEDNPADGTAAEEDVPAADDAHNAAADDLVHGEVPAPAAAEAKEPACQGTATIPVKVVDLQTGAVTSAAVPLKLEAIDKN